MHAAWIRHTRARLGREQMAHRVTGRCYRADRLSGACKSRRYMLPCSVTSDLRAAYHYSSGLLKSHLGERMRCGKFDRKPPLIDAPRKEE